MARKSNKRKGKGNKVYALIVDGETEVWYFNMMYRNEKQILPKVNIQPKLPKKRRLKEQYEEVVNYLELNVYETVIWLLDFDTIIKEDKERKKGQESSIQALKKYKEKLEKYNSDEKSPKVKVLVNTPCLEFWYLLHFEKTSRYYSQCLPAIQDLKKHLHGYEKKQDYYVKQGNDIYLRLKPYLVQALANAGKLGDLDFYNPQSAKAEIYKIFSILGIDKRPV